MDTSFSPPTTTKLNKVGSVDNSYQQNNVGGSPRKNSWRWWSNNKSAEITKSNKNNEENENHDCNSSIAQSSLVVHHSIHSKESDDILSTTSIKSKPFISQKLKSAAASTCPTQQEKDEEDTEAQGATTTTAIIDPKVEDYKTDTNDPNSTTTPSSSLFQNVPSITSSTVPVINFDPNKERPHRKSFDNLLFSGIKAKFSRWVNKSTSTTNSITDKHSNIKDF